MPPTKFYFLCAVCAYIYLLSSFRNLNTNQADAKGMPGVGISLTVSYAVLSIRKDDGSYEDIGQIYNNDEYIEAMQRLSLPEAQHPSPPYDNMEDLYSDWKRQLLRRTRMRIGLPASSHVGVLSRMLDQLLSLPASSTTPSSSSTPYALSLRQLPIVITYSALPGLYNEDIADAATYLGIHLVPGPQLMYQPRTMYAAYAGHGLGLCVKFEDEEVCRQEGLDMPVREVLLVEYTEHALLLHANVVREARDLANRDSHFSADYGLGSNKTEGKEGAAKVANWALRFLKEKYGDGEAPERLTVVATGDGWRKEVVDAIREVVKAFGSDVTVLDKGAEYVAARGAAEMAWRAARQQERPDL